MKKLLGIFLTLCLSASLFSACSGESNPSSTTKPATTPASQESKSPDASTAPTTTSYDLNNVGKDFPVDTYITEQTARWNLGHNVDMTWYFNYSHHYATNPWSEYPALKVAADITGINITGDIPTGDPTEKVNLMMATNALPDLVTLGFGDPLGKALIDGGFVYCLEDLLKEYEPEFWSNMPKSLYESNTFEDVDGKMWAISGVTMAEWQYTNKYGLGGHGYNVRKDIWEELGEPSIATPDDLLSTLKLFKEKYPEMGSKTSVGIASYALGEGVMNTMSYSFGIGDYYYNETTSMTEPKFMNPQYIEFVAYMNLLYREGLLDPEFFTKDDQKNIETLSTSAFMLPYVFWACDPASATLKTIDPNSKYIAIPPMSATGEAYQAPAALSRLGAVQTYISKSCVDPAAAARLIAYGFSPEGTMQTSRGTPGIHWYSTDGVWEVSDEVLEARKTDEAAYNMANGIWDYYSLWYPSMPQKITDEADRVNYDRANTDPFAYDNTIDIYNMRPEPNSDAGIAEATIKTITDRGLANAIIADSAEKSAQAFEEMIKAIADTKGYDKLVEFYSEQRAKNQAKFGSPKF